MRRLCSSILMLFLLSIFVFYMARMSPGDPLRAYYGDGVERISQIQKEKTEKQLGLNKPIFVQYLKWLKQVSKGQFGISFKYKQNVLTVIKTRLFNTLLLGGISYVITFLFALILGIFCSLNEENWIDYIFFRIGTIINCIPAFWISLILILIFSINLKWLPSGGAYQIGKANSIPNRMIYLILPVTVLILGHLWYYAYIIRNKLLEEIRKDYVLFAKAKGLRKVQIVVFHCLPNILPFYFNLMAVSIPHILTGTYIVEEVFSYPGLGSLAIESAKYHDYNLLMVLCLLTGVIVIIANLFAQILSEKIDPRMGGTKTLV